MALSLHTFRYFSTGIFLVSVCFPVDCITCYDLDVSIITVTNIRCARSFLLVAAVEGSFCLSLGCAKSQHRQTSGGGSFFHKLLTVGLIEF